MRKIDIINYGMIISDKETGNQLLGDLRKILNNGEDVEVNMKDVISMATFCSKQIFGTLYLELGSKVFFTKIKFINASEDILTIIKIGIQSALDEYPQKP